MSTHVDGAGPSMTPDEDGDPGTSPETDTDTGSEWVRAEMQRRMAANRSTRGRHARSGEVPPPALRGGDQPSRGALSDSAIPNAARPDPMRPQALRPNGARQDGGWPGDRRRPEHPLPPPPWAPAPVSAADLPENYVPRHSVQTPGPAADPAEPISGPVPVIRPAGGGIGGGAAGGTSEGLIGGPSLPPSGLPIRRRRGSGPGTPLQADVATPAAAWLRPGPIVPHEPARRLGAPPEMLGAPEPIPAWGLPLASPPRGFAVPGVPDPAPDVAAADTGAPVSDPAPAVEQAAEPGPGEVDVDERDDLAPETDGVAPNGHALPTASEVGSDDAADEDEDDDDDDRDDDEDDDEVDAVWVPRALVEDVRAGPVTEPAPDAGSAGGPVRVEGAGPVNGAGRANGSAPVQGGTPALARLDAAANGMMSPPSGPIDLTGLTGLTGLAGPQAAPAPSAAPAPADVPVPGETPEETTDEIAGGLTDMPTAPHPIVAAARAGSSRHTVGVPDQRTAEQAGALTPRPVTPRDIPVVGTAPPEPGSTRVRVVLSERKGIARPVRTIKEVQEGTAVGELLRRDLIRSQLKVTARFALLTLLVLGALPAVFALLPEVSRFELVGIRLPWVLLGVLMYPFLVGVAWRYTRVADRVEQNFADHVQD